MKNKKSKIKDKKHKLKNVKIFKFLSFWVCVFYFWYLIFGFSTALENPDQKVSEVIKDYVAVKYPDFSKEEIKVTFKYAENVFAKLAAKGEEVSLKIIELYSDFKPLGNLILPIEVSEKGGPKERVFVQAKVEVYKDVVTAVGTLKKGKILSESDFKIEKRDIALFPQKYVVSTAGLIGKEARMTVPKGALIFSWMAGDLPLVRRGEEVEIAVSSGALRVKSKGIAMENGYPNETIKVKREGAKHVIHALVTAPGRVEVKL